MTEKLKRYNQTLQRVLHQEVGWFLEKYNIKFFSYQRFYEDGRHFSLFSSQLWSDFYLTDMNLDSPAFAQMAYNLDPNTFNLRLWPTDREDAVVNALHHHDLWHGVNIYQKCPEGMEIWEFCGDRQSQNLLNFYLSESALLKQFILYLRPRIQPYIYPEDPTIYANFNNKLITPKANFDWVESTRCLFCIGHNGPIELSPQETRCVQGLEKGYTAKEIAFYLDLKPKTVEEYLSNARKKLGVQKNTQIICVLQGLPR